MDQLICLIFWCVVAIGVGILTSEGIGRLAFWLGDKKWGL